MQINNNTPMLLKEGENLSSITGKNITSSALKTFPHISHPDVSSKETNPLELSYSQKVAFAMSLISIASLLTQGGNASALMAGAGLAFQVGLSGYNCIQNPCYQTVSSIAIPFVFQGVQIGIAFTPLRPVLPYLMLMLQVRSSYQMGIDIYNQAKISLKLMDKENYLHILRNLFVYSVNASVSTFHLYNSCQKTFLTQPETTEFPKKTEQEEINEAKSTLCEGQEKCSLETPKEIKKLYRIQSLKLHPDKTQAATGEAFATLTNARDVLLKSLKGKASQATETSAKTEQAPSFTKQESSSFPIQVNQGPQSILGILADVLSTIDSFLRFPVAHATDAPEPLAERSTLGPIEDKLAANVLGDKYILGSDLEGLHPAEATYFLTRIAATLPEKLQNNISELLQNIEEIPEAASKEYRAGIFFNTNPYVGRTLEKLSQLAPGKSFYLSGGWKDKNRAAVGHRIFYEFSKREDGNFDFYLYNTGEGTQYHYQEISSESDENINAPRQRLICPFVKFENISPVEIGIGIETGEDKNRNSHLLTSLVSLYLGSDSPNKAEELYVKALSPLEHRKIKDPRIRSDFFLTSPQFSGTCGWRALFYAVLRKKLADESTFQELELKVRRDTFDAYCSISPKAHTSSQRELCIKAGEELFRDLAMRYESSLTSSEVQKDRDSLATIVDFLKSALKEEASQETPTMPISFQGDLSSLELSESIQEVIPIHYEPNAAFPPNPPQVIVISDLMHELKSIQNFTGTNQVYDLSMQIENLVKALPSPLQFKDYWKEASIEEIQEAQELLTKALSLYTSQVFREHRGLTIEHNTAWALLALIHNFSLRIDARRGRFGKLLSDYGINYKKLHNLVERPKFTCFRKEDLAFYQEILAYFQSVEKQATLFDFTIHNILENSPLSADEQFLSSIIQEPSYSELRSYLQKKVDEIKLNFQNDLRALPQSVLERSILLTNNEMFSSDPRTKHIARLKDAAYLAQSFLGERQYKKAPPDQYQGSFYRDFQAPYATLDQGGLTKWLAENLVYTLEKEFDADLFSSILGESYLQTIEFFSKKEQHAVSENQIILFNANPKPLSPHLATITCEKTLQCAKLIDSFSGRLGDFTDTKVQNILLLSLFQVVRDPETGQITVPIHEAIKNPHFIDQVSEFITNGMHIFSESIENPQIAPSLFFIQIARRLKELDPTLPLPDYSSKINEWLSNKKLDLSDEDLANLHLHRMMQYTNDVQNLRKLSPEQARDSQKLQEIVESWVYVSTHPLSSWQFMHGQAEAASFIFSLKSVLSNLPSECISKVLQRLIPGQSKIINTQSFASSLDYPFFYTSQGIDQGKISLDVLHGEIYLDEEKVFFGAPQDLIESTAYKELFGNKKFTLKKQSDYFIFQDDKLRNYRIFVTRWREYIQVNIDGQWYEYVPQFSLSKLSAEIPKPLLANHHIFRSGKKRIFIHKKSQEIAFQDDKLLVDTSNTPIVRPKDCHFSTSMEHFEPHSWLVVSGSEKGPFSIQFPRFRSFQNTPLELTATDQEISWKGQPHFILKTPPFAMLGKCINYLFFENSVEGKKKIIVPLRPVQSSQEFAPHCKLNIEDSDVLDFKNQRFIEADIENGQIKALNPEGALFFSYIFLAQKEYAKALSFLKNDLNLKRHFKMTPEGREILNWIVQLPLSSSDRTSSSTAVALRATMMLLQDLQLNPNYETQKKLSVSCRALWRTYEQELDNVEAKARLSSEELLKLKSLASFFSINLKWNTHQKQGEFPFFIKDSKWHEFQKKSNLDRLNEIKTDFASANELEKKKALECYEQFRQSKTREERVFLITKYWDFFKSKEFSKFRHIFHAVLHDDRLLLPFSKDNAWFQQFTQMPYENERSDVLGIFSSKVPSEPLFPRPRSAIQPLFRAIEKVRGKKTSTSFPLASLSLPSHSLLKDTANVFLSIEKPQEQTCPSLEMPSYKLTSIPEAYQSAVLREIQDVEQEYRYGVEKNQKEVRYTVQKGKTLADLHSKLQELLSQKFQPQIQKLESSILNLVHRPPQDSHLEELEQLLIDGNAVGRAEMDDVITAFLKGKSEAYLSINSYLKPNEIQKLDTLVQEFLTLSIESAQIKRALSSRNPQIVGNILSAEMAYTTEEYRALQRQFLVYEYRSGFRIRDNQAALIAKMVQKNDQGKYISSVWQLIMGGGKTAVLGPNILYHAAQVGRIAMFIAPAAQFDTLRENLGNSQKAFFRQSIIPMHFTRNELTSENIAWIYEQFMQAKAGDGILLSTRPTIEFLQLEFLNLLKQGKERSLSPKEWANIEKLFYINTQLGTATDLLCDEVDVVLHAKHETNLAIGAKTRIDAELINMSRHIFALLSKEFEEKVRLTENKQNALGETASKEILKLVAERLLDTYQLDLKAEKKKEFLSFVLGDKDISAQQLFAETTSEQKEKISLIKHFLCDVLPLTLSKGTGQHYGRVPRGENEEEVGPYNGSDTPAFTEFGSPWEAIAYHFQTVLSKGTIESQVQALAEDLYTSAVYESLAHYILLKDTWEEKTFKKLTGISLLERKDPDLLKEATARINQNLEAKLFIESNTIAKIVGYYENYFRSTPQSFFQQIDTFRAYTGTPSWNSHTYPKSLQENVNLDLGTEGKIIHTYMQRATPDTVHITPSSQVAETLQTVLGKMSEERKERLCGFIDVAGLFKDHNSHQIARDILRFHEKDDRIQTVLYFGRPSLRSPITLMALKKGAKSPIVIGSSQKEEIAKHGISPESTFVYYDDSHCEATDIPQKENAVNIISVSHKTTLRTLLQGMLRERGYFEKQDLDYLITQEEQKHFSENTTALPTHQEILFQMIYNQAMIKTEESLRSYKQKIDNAIRQIPIDLIFHSKTLEEASKFLDVYQELLLIVMKMDLFSMFGRDETLIDTLQVLEKYRSKKENQFYRLTSDPIVRNLLKTRLDEIMASAKASPYLPSVAINPVREGGDLETQMQVALETHKEVDTEQELDLELQQELDSYQQIGFYQNSFVEKQWTKDLVTSEALAPTTRSWLNMFSLLNIFRQQKAPQIHSLPHFLEKGPITYKAEYHKIFDDSLWISDNFAHTQTELAPIFAHKIQKQADQVLVIKKNGELKAILISSLEGDFFYKYLETHKPKDMWLLLPNGKSYVKHFPPMSPKDIQSLRKLLWQTNVFNGNIAALLKDEQSYQEVLRLDDSYRNLWERFLKLKVEHNPGQKTLFYRYFAKEQTTRSKHPLLALME